MAWVKTESLSNTPDALGRRNAVETWSLKDRDGVDVATITKDADDKVAVQSTGNAIETLTDGATITWTFVGNEARNAKVTLGGNRTLALSGCTAGASGTLIVVQGAGGQTLTLPSGSYVVNAGAGVATLSSGAADRDVLSFLYVSSTEIYWTVGLDFTSA
jgi:hypothetical protein